ncbi:hypothetical protein [uncultured Serinicoccus sp.]|nr:hypothetical protein [uncultured Serinicoccus sp.]
MGTGRPFDVVLGPDGPVLVDVNAFPGYRGVPGAPQALADLVADRVGTSR